MVLLAPSANQVTKQNIYVDEICISKLAKIASVEFEEEKSYSAYDNKFIIWYEISETVI